MKQVQDAIEGLKDFDFAGRKFDTQSGNVITNLLTDVLNKVTPFITDLSAMEIPTNEEELIDFICDDVKNLVINGTRVIAGTVIDAVEDIIDLFN